MHAERETLGARGAAENSREKVEEWLHVYALQNNR
jgi:hypothetical protein